jgi:hypothetical protein
MGRLFLHSKRAARLPTIVAGDKGGERREGLGQLRWVKPEPTDGDGTRFGTRFDGQSGQFFGRKAEAFKKKLVVRDIVAEHPVWRFCVGVDCGSVSDAGFTHAARS